MQFGVGLPNYGKGKTFEDIKRVALRAEELGYDSVWTTDHVIVPQTDIEPYGNIMESLTVLAMVAAVTTRVKLGTSVLVLPQRNAVLAAKQIATIDAASGGRMIVGVGVGWNATEFGNLGMNFKNRGKRLDEAIELLRALWSSEDATFHGKYTQLDRAVFAPLPAQKQIPIWIGGNGEPAWQRAATLGDGWHATGALPADYARGIQHINASKPARTQTFSARLTIDLNPNASPYYEYRGAKRQRLAGTDNQVRAILREYAQAGLQYAALFFPMSNVAVGLAQMERFMHEIAPEFN
ncbi:MAG: TIGR03619 family F420-dependent LLM class oxidoreductase [Chloroflexi bacterium]|nr:TIGR03619 family F420-dependent LLM class oxidoreductase [Chloroflexota bacterium]